jgi:hypothetical protein
MSACRGEAIITVGARASALALASSPGHALSFDFSFTNSRLLLAATYGVRAGHGSIPDRKTVMLDDVVIHDRIRSLAQQLGNAV